MMIIIDDNLDDLVSVQWPPSNMIFSFYGDRILINVITENVQTVGGKCLNLFYEK